MNYNNILKTILCIIILPAIILPAIILSQGKPRTTVEEEILKEINLARTNPKEYVEILKGLKKYFYGKELRLPGKTRLITYEGVSVLNEAIAFMNNQKPILPIKFAKGLNSAAKIHMEEQSKKGTVGHIGLNGQDFAYRMEQFGKWTGSVAENIGYGSSEARSIVYQLIIDDGVELRGHRTNIFNPDYKVIGIAFGSHPKWRTVCVMDFAEGYIDSGK